MPPLGTCAEIPRQTTRSLEFDTSTEAMNAATLFFRIGLDVFVSPKHRTAPVEHDVWIVEVTR